MEVSDFPDPIRPDAEPVCGEVVEAERRQSASRLAKPMRSRPRKVCSTVA